MYTHTGAGAYECGEESALLESLEGKRGVPRLKPPFPAVVGAFQSPTILNNTETFSSIPPIFRGGAEWYAVLGSPKNGGTRIMCVSGHVNQPGVYEMPMGFPLMRLIEEVCGGVRNGKKLKAVIPGGSSCLASGRTSVTSRSTSTHWQKPRQWPARVVWLCSMKTPISSRSRSAPSSFMHMKAVAGVFLAEKGPRGSRKCSRAFTMAADCGGDIDLIGELAANMLGRTFCPLGDAAAMPTGAFVAKFRDEFEARLQQTRPAKNILELVHG